MAGDVRRVRSTRLPSAVNVAIGLLMVALIVPLALTASQLQPPAIAEFAPQAFQVPHTARGTSAFGVGDELGQQAVGLPTPTPVSTPTPAPIDSARVLPCVGGLQVPDPQSPACVPYWTGNNGGATAFGVTPTQITISFGEDQGNLRQDLQTYFNRHFEFYGRQLNVVSGPPFDWQFGSAADEQHAAYVQQTGAFASMGLYGGGTGGEDQSYCDDLAQRHIVCATPFYTDWTEDALSAHQPYEWTTLPGLDRQERGLADMVCTTLKGQPPRLAPPQTSQRYPTGPPVRQFAVIRGKNFSGATSMPDVSILVNAMDACGAAPVFEADLSDPPGSSAGNQEASNAMLGIVKNDATTVICICDYSYVGQALMPQADQQHRTPEWVVNTYGDQDRDDQVPLRMSQQDLQSQQPHAFGISWQNEPLDVGREPWCLALHEVDPQYACANGIPVSATMYSSLLLIAAGIQYAGPHLTPETFQQGLFQAQFPNPGDSGPPYYEALVGFGPGDHSEYQNAGLIWWNPNRRSPMGNTQPGSYCWVEGGRRFATGGFPSNDKLLQSSC